MSGNELLSRENVLKENFNSQHVELSDVSSFMMYFVWLLQIAFEIGLIGLEQRNLIATYLSQAIEESVIVNREFDDKKKTIENYMYVVALYLHSKSNWEAWRELNNINSIKDAKEFLKSAKGWLKVKLKALLFNLSKINMTVLKVDLKNVTACYQNLINIIKQFEGFDYANVRLSLKISHNDTNVVNACNYVFLKDYSRIPNFLERLNRVVNEFCIEVSILNAINAKEIVKNKQIEAREDYSKGFSEIENIDRAYQKKLRAIRKERDDNLDYYFKSLHRPGRKRKGCADEVEIEREYSRKKRALEIAYKKRIEQIKKKHEEATYNKMELLQDDYSLVDIIKEYAIFSLAKSGKISYPETLEERAKMLNALDLNFAITEFIKMNKLTVKQLEYLERE